MIPTELKQLKQWCIWKYEQRNNKRTKVPYSIDDRMAKSNDESTWATYEDARAALSTHQADGVGFFFKPPYMGIDLDNIADEVERFKRNDIAENVIFEMYESLKSYAEYSPSGTGIHIIIKGAVPGPRRRKGDVEMYDSGRFFTMTGDSLGKYTEINTPADMTIERLYKKYVGADNVVHMPTNDHGVTHDLSESEIVARILNSKQSELFKRFMNDDWQELYTSQSEADMAFANLLAFWCARDYTKMDALFRQSSLMRGKWDERRGKTTYGEGTLYKAINEAQNVYTPRRQQTESLKYDINFGTGEIDQPKDYPNRSWDDTGNADRFMDRFGDLVKYSYIDNKFYVYDGSKWQKDDKGQVRQLIDATIQDMKNETITAPDGVEPEEIEKAWQKHLKNSRNNSKKKALQDELKHRVPVMPNEFDQDDMLLNVDNGYLDLSSGSLYPHDITKLFARQANYEYTDTMDAPTWLNFLNDIFDGDAELITYMQKAIGYSLTGSTKEQVMFILFGKGRNGKSLFVETISEIIGNYARNIRADSLMVKQSGGVNNDIAALNGARFVTSSEPNEGFRFDEGLIKQLTGGDRITARFLYGEDFEFTPKFKIWVSTNHKPIIRGTDDGIWRRMMLIPFTVQIPEHKVDKELKYKLLREAPAILDWMLEGALLWQKEGLNMPGVVEKASREYRQEMDVIEQFLDEMCERGRERQAPAGELFKKYREWARENEEYMMSKQKFSQKMKEKFEYKKTKNGRFYEGVSFLEKYPGLGGLR